MYSKEEVYKKVEELVIKFRNNKDQYTNKNYNETETRRDFLDPFFEAFGWDVSNRAGKSQTYRDVIHEDKVKVGKETKAPDYAFRIGGNRVFFVEAKKPGVNLKEDSLPAFQLRRYGWSAKLGISFLTDFEELAVYDCTRKPNVNDKASTARIEYIHFEDYLNRFDFLYEILNKERIEQGSLEKYIAGTSNKKGTESVDIDFLNSLDNLRTKLASNIAKLNKNLSVRDLNYAVQQIIDRIIFLRAAEDRGIEEYGDLKKTCENKGDNFYSNLLKIFEKADGRYNSGLFDFSKDSISSSIEIDNKVIKEIINELYYPLSPYEFSVISVEIIGNAYEQFLGKTITIGKNHSAKIELKPEVRKAGGVYYTPEYIVDYIVANTVGEAIKGKKPEEIANIKILDPACGSGSFLLGAYKYLLNYHIEYYNKIKDRAKFKGSKEDVIKENGDLTIWIKKQILRNNIFGVDIDSNAVEVTKLSLLMKCLEGENPASIQNNQDLFNERALPSLEDNIKCGNSLIGNDFYESQSVLDFDEETQYKINCFDWEDEFKNIFKGGGFDVVIGNPPYGAELSEIERNYLEKKFSLGNTNTAALFLGVLKKFLKDNCKGGYIIPKSFIYASNWESSRDLMIDDLFELVDCGKVWKEVKLEQVITLFEKGLKNDSYITSIREDKEIKRIGNINKNTYKEFGFYLNAVSNDELNIAYKMRKSGLYLNDLIINRRGAGYQKLCIDEVNNKEKYYKVLGGKNIARYIFPNNSKKYLLKEDVVDDKAIIQDNSILVQNIISYTDIPEPSIIIRGIPSNLINKNEYVILDTINQLSNKSNLSIYYILGLLNSKLISWYVFKFIYGKAIMTMHFDSVVTAKIPIPNIDFNDKNIIDNYNKIIELVKTRIILETKLNDENNPNTINILKRQINGVENSIEKIINFFYKIK
ncbi:Eco57I restriction-modification methylase domain-containing protein [Brachyspira intermedia]|uniref:Eco57I restriction-modification methylase domain-containing protein n=1 Tax=Brachyspira intermedia TaxID=84377 RepID=UPI0030045958